MRESAKAALSGGITIALLLCAEGVSRWIAPTPIRDPLVTRAQEEWSEEREADDLLFWKMRANRLKDGAPYTNSLGLRGPEVPASSPEEFRILLLGESSTFGWGVEYRWTYAARLERQLGSVDGRRVRVVNAGVPGYTMLQGFAYLAHRGLALEPDAVLVAFGYNDSLPVSFRARRSPLLTSRWGMSDLELFEMRQKPWVRLALGLMRHSNLIRVLALPSGAEVSLEGEGASRARVPDADRRRLLDDLRALCERNGIRFVIVIPWYSRFEDHIPLLRDYARSAQVAVVDLPARLDSLPGGRSRYFLLNDRLHPSRRGHREIADVLESELRRLWGEPGPAPGAAARRAPAGGG